MLKWFACILTMTYKIMYLFFIWYNTDYQSIMINWNESASMINTRMFLPSAHLSLPKHILRTSCCIYGQLSWFCSVWKYSMFKTMRIRVLLHYLELSINTFWYILRHDELWYGFSHKIHWNLNRFESVQI